MTTEDSTACDSEGYRLVPLKFKQGGYVYEFVQQVDDQWRIYSVTNPQTEILIDYELVKFTRSEEYRLGDAVIPKKWNYPTANAFGRNGFSVRSISAALAKHRAVVQKGDDREKGESKIAIPVNEEFTITELAKKLGTSYYHVNMAVKALGDRVQRCRVITSARGRDTQVFILSPEKA